MGIIEKIKLIKLRHEWRTRNSNNNTIIVRNCKIDLITVGKCTYGPINVISYNSVNKLKIGNYCSIAPGVIFLLSADHYTNHISTFPFKEKILNTPGEAISKGNIVIDDDVWIGYGAIILSGVHIGQGAVIAAGAVVTSNVSPYTVVGGIPAKKIKKRFDDKVIETLLTLDYSQLTSRLIKEQINSLYVNIEECDIKKLLNWFPKKHSFSKEKR